MRFQIVLFLCWYLTAPIDIMMVGLLNLITWSGLHCQSDVLCLDTYMGGYPEWQLRYLLLMQWLFIDPRMHKALGITKDCFVYRTSLIPWIIPSTMLDRYESRIVPYCYKWNEPDEDHLRFW